MPGNSKLTIQYTKKNSAMRLRLRGKKRLAASLSHVLADLSVSHRTALRVTDT